MYKISPGEYKRWEETHIDPLTFDQEVSTDDLPQCEACGIRVGSKESEREEFNLSTVKTHVGEKQMCDFCAWDYRRMRSKYGDPEKLKAIPARSRPCLI